MSQVNFKVDKEIEGIIEELAKQEGKSKSKLVKEYFMAGFREKIIPKLLELYTKGKISLKKLIKLAPIPPHDVFSLISKNEIEPNFPPELDDYTHDVATKIIKKIKNEENLMKSK